MTTYLSSLSSHYTSLKRLIPSSASSDSDAHCTDPTDSQVSRVLRAYYTEKGRPFPSWLGPDPNAAAPARAAPSYLAPALSRHASANNTAPAARPPLRHGLGDLFGDDSGSAAGGPHSEPTSLRAGGRRGPAANLRAPGFAGGASDSIPYPSRVPGAPAPAPQQPPAPQRRPLPSERLGSYQNRPPPEPAPRAEEKASMQDRLRARLGGARSTSPSPSPGPGFADAGGGGGRHRPYGGDRSDSGGGGGSGSYAPYEGGDLGAGGFNPYASGGRGGNPYLSAPSDDRYGGGGSRGGGRPYTAAASPWETGDDLGGDLATEQRRGPGLPANPRRWK